MVWTMEAQAPGVAFVVLDPCTVLPLIILYIDSSFRICSVGRHECRSVSGLENITCELFIAGFRAVNYLE
jgi:hypothetical protein